MYEKSILIIGAGPTGLTLAIDLARRGVNFRLLEAADTPFQGSRGKGIQPRTLEVFEDLGVIDQILAAGAPYPKFRIHLGPLSMRAGSLGSSKPSTERIPYPNLWMVRQSRTEEILRERLHQLGHEVEFSTALANLEQSDHSVHATLSNGETVHAEYLIGCDGGHSAVRKSLGLKLEGEAIDEEPSVVADVEIKNLDRRDWHIWPSLKGAAIGLCPLPNTQFFQLMAKAASIGDNIEQAVFKVTGHRIERIAWRSIYQHSVRMVNRYRVGRVFLAGDAAHVHPPSGGQGLNTGVQDAYNLGWKLAHVVNGGPASLLDTYESERLPIAAAVLGLTKHLHQTRSIKRGDATNQLALHYRTSALSSGHTLGDLSPGDRMPDRRIGNSRLFELMRGPQATELQLPDGTKILIRPDGYIASISQKESTDYAGMPIQQIR
ncbi:FAD-dependent monooxygenase [Tunturiibacter lichenicola]|uniref:FAD-dependent monooxygenase n=1 Tax=Tunturiibacter lichenicola TaxID=2051959 RepID=UPI003D9B5B8B